MTTKTNPITLESIIARSKPLAVKALNSEIVYNELCKEIADGILDLRELHTYEGRDEKVGTDGTVTRTAVPKGTDWKGLSKAYNGELEKFWNAVLPDTLTNGWVARTGKSASEFPLRKNVGYYVALRIQDRIGVEQCEAYGIPTGTRQEQAAAKAKANQARKAADTEAGNTAFVVNGAPVPQRVLNAVEAALEAVEAMKGHPLPMDIAFKLVPMLQSLSINSSALVTDLMAAFNPVRQAS